MTPEGKDPVAQAREDLNRAYIAATGMNVFDTKTAAVIEAALKYVHAVVTAERDRVLEGYTDSGADSTPDLDALDRVVDLTEPERLSKGL